MIEFETTAVKSKSDKGYYFSCFGINQKSAGIYGRSVDDIVKVKCSEIEGSTYSNRDKSKDYDIVYWGWQDKNGSIAQGLIWYTILHFNTCFTYGIESEESLGKGRAFRLTVEEI